MVQKLGCLSVSGLIINFFSAPAADNQSAGFQLAQMMGDGRTAHVHHGGNIDDAFLTVAEKPEDLDAASISELLEYFSGSLKIFRCGHLLQPMFYLLSMIVGQRLPFHNNLLENDLIETCK